jgi:hypothetical protein
MSVALTLARDAGLRQERYRFHATDGVSLIPDTKRAWVRGASDRAWRARARIRGRMAAMAFDLDWSNWTVDRGRHVVFVDFTREGTSRAGYAHELPEPAVRAEAEAVDAGSTGHGADGERHLEAG